MFGGSSNNGNAGQDTDSKPDKSPSPGSSPSSSESVPTKAPPADQVASGEKRSGNGSPPDRNDAGGSTEKKRRSSGMSNKASSLLASAKNSLNFSQSGRGSDLSSQSPIQKLGKQDPALAVPQGQHNNSAGDSVPGPKSTFRVGVWEDRNKKCRRTMEDTHAFLYNFLDTPAPATEGLDKAKSDSDDPETVDKEVNQSDNGYFAIFDGHAGTFAADWCGKKLHIILEDIIRKNPNVPIPELLDQTFTSVDAQLEKLPLKNSGCTAAVAVLRWEDRVPSERSATGSQSIAPAAAAATKASRSDDAPSVEQDESAPTTSAEEALETANVASTQEAHEKLKNHASRQRVLYTANVGDARIVLCRSGKALRLSYDHKGSDENEGKRITSAGGLILNNRVNGVLAVTRALGDTYMKDLVTGHPYTTETVIQPDSDEFMIIACDGLWDVCSDQEAVDLVRNVSDPAVASRQLVSSALDRFSTDNLSCMVVRFDKAALIEHQTNKDVGVETGSDTGNKISEADKIVAETRQSIIEGSSSGIGVSASNSGRGHDPVAIENEGDFVPTTLSEHLEEEPSAIEEEEEDEKGNAPVRNNIVPKREEPTVAEAKVAEEEKPAEESSATKVQ
ncbi:protein phosphatase 2C domain-containing protein [Sarocladium implicatum]|nr:protein phosphatase 2C domain-containing protein [Sarocladium implicatum]